MAFLDIVRNRQSVRQYLPRPVPREAIDRCIEAARLAPSACNSQPWSFIVVDDPAKKDALADAAFSGPYAMCSFARHASVLLAVVTERSTFAAALGGFFKGVQFSLVDIGIAVEHLVLQAAEEGIGTCWLGWFSESGVKKVLGLPRSAHVNILVSMGYPVDETLRPKVRKDLDAIRRYA